VRAYSLGSPFGKVPCEFLQKGHSTEINASFKEDPIAVWGQLRGAKEILSKSKHFYRMDHAYVGRLEFYRMTRGDFQPRGMVSRPSDRWDWLKTRFKLKVGGWQKGKHVLVTLSDQRTYDFFGESKWPKEIEALVKNHTDRPVVMRPRTDTRPLAEHLKDAWCLVTFASNSAIDALLAGVPVFTLGPHITRPVGLSDLTKIEAPHYPENREEFFRHMAYCQFTNDEFRSGFARKMADETANAGTVT
jgi:hypothetical protein